jgi:hypothetical protein
MKQKRKAKPAFDLTDFLTKGDGGRTRADYGESGVIFSQGDSADAVFYIHKCLARWQSVPFTR